MNKLINILARITGQKSVYPFYHAVANTPALHLKHLYQVRSTELFEQDILFFKSIYQSVSAHELGESKNDFVFHLSFDDGLREFKELAFPILKKHNVSVSLFVNPAFVDNKDLFYRFKASLLIEHVKCLSNIDFHSLSEACNAKISDAETLQSFLFGIDYSQQAVLDTIADFFQYSFSNYLEKYKPYLSTQELKYLAAEGVSIGAHSMDHPLFHKITYDEQVLQIKKSCNWVQENIHPMTNLFSFPFTDYGLGKKLFKAMEQNMELDFSFGTAGMKKETFFQHIQRIPMEDNMASAQKILLNQYLYYLAKVPFFKNTIKR